MDAALLKPFLQAQPDEEMYVGEMLLYLLDGRVG